MPREKTGAEIVVGADRIADNQADLLAAVELLDAFALRAAAAKSAAKKNRGSNLSTALANRVMVEPRHGGCQFSSTMARTGVASTFTMASGKQISVTRSFVI